MLCVFAATGVLACGGGAPAPKTQEMVPANSANEPEKKDDATTTSGTTSDPGATAGATNAGAGGGSAGGGGGKPAGGGGAGSSGAGAMPQKIGGDAPGSTPTPAPSGGTSGSTAPAAGGPKVTKAECKKVLDRYVDLAIAADPNLAGLPPDVVKQAFAQAASQSANPCDGDGVSRNQYKCAMKATTTDAWQTCMK
jgi:hypothetical protein